MSHELARVARLVAESVERELSYPWGYDSPMYLCAVAYEVCEDAFPYRLSYEYAWILHVYFGPDNYLGGGHDGLNEGVWKDDMDARLIGAYLLAEILEDECR